MERSPVELNDCPNEILSRVFSHFDQIILMRSASRVCKRWNIISKARLLWTYVDCSAAALKLRNVKKMLNQNLIGDHTLHLLIKFNNTTTGIDTTVKAILERCQSLQRLKLYYGHMQIPTDFFRQLQPTIRMLELDRVASGLKRLSVCESSIPPMHNIESLAVKHCAWFCDSHLTAVLKRSCSLPCHSNLRVLIVSGCSHLFEGFPSTASLQTRITCLHNQLGSLCPNLRHLDVSSVFTVSLRQEELELSPTAVLSTLTDRLTQLSHINLSYNHSIVHLLQSHQSKEILRAFQAALANLNFIIRPNDNESVTLQLSGWPVELIGIFVQAATFLISNHLGHLALIVDEDSVHMPHSCDRISLMKADQVCRKKRVPQHGSMQSHILSKRMKNL